DLHCGCGSKPAGHYDGATTFGDRGLCLFVHVRGDGCGSVHLVLLRPSSRCGGQWGNDQQRVAACGRQLHRPGTGDRGGGRVWVLGLPARHCASSCTSTDCEPLGGGLEEGALMSGEWQGLFNLMGGLISGG